MKNFFQNLALASLAITGILVSSCQVEDIQTTFEPKPAVATITVKVFDVTDANNDVTSKANLFTDSNNANIKIVGNVITVTGTPEIAAQTFTVFATVDGLSSGDTKVDIPSLLAGGQAQIPATILVGKLAEGYRLGTRRVIGPTMEVGRFESLFGHATHTHSYKYATVGHNSDIDGEWLYNETEFILNTEVEYNSLCGVSKDYSYCNINDKATQNDIPIVNAYYDAYLLNSVVAEKKKLPITVSAFSMYSVFGCRLIYIEEYTVIRENADETETTIATFGIGNVVTTVEYCEAAIPGHEGHYHFGHGHDDIHGYSSNAGGGIFLGE